MTAQILIIWSNTFKKTKFPLSVVIICVFQDCCKTHKRVTSVRKCRKGDKTLKAWSEYNTKEGHQFSTIVYKAGGQTFYTTSKTWCLLRGRKYQNSILKQSVILLNFYKVKSARGLCCMFSTQLGHSTLDKRCGPTRDVVRQGRKLGVGWGAENSFLTCQAFSSH